MSEQMELVNLEAGLKKRRGKESDRRGGNNRSNRDGYNRKQVFFVVVLLIRDQDPVLIPSEERIEKEMIGLILKSKENLGKR